MEAVVASDGEEQHWSNEDAKPSTGLTKEEKAIIAKYHTMLKMQVPKDAVQHKMTMD